jgi:hypothetical protein
MGKKKKRRKSSAAGADERYRVFVDYENSPESLALVEEFDVDEVWIFVGRQQKKIPLEFVQRMQRLGRDVHWVAPGVVGKNALDFILAMHVGIHHEKADQGIAFAILSADKGYDPLLKELAHDDRTAVRVNPERAAKKKTKKRRTRAAKKTAAASEPAQPAAKKKKRATRKTKAVRTSEAGEGPVTVARLVERVAERLDRMSEERLPTREKTLLKHVESQLPAEYQEKAGSVVRGLVRRKRVRIQARTGAVTYPGR